MGISKYLDEQLVVFLEENEKNGAISRLIDLLDGQGRLKTKEPFHTAILEREKIVSTGIGIGVAVPHAKIEGHTDFFIAIGIQKNKGIDWSSIDGALVRLVFMIGGPENKRTEYLKILSSITQAMKDEAKRKKILRCCHAKEVIQLLTEN